MVTIINLNVSALIVDRNALTVNGGTSNLTILQNQSVFVWSDGSNYFYGTERGRKEPPVQLAGLVRAGTTGATGPSGSAGAGGAPELTGAGGSAAAVAGATGATGAGSTGATGPEWVSRSRWCKPSYRPQRVASGANRSTRQHPSGDSFTFTYDNSPVSWTVTAEMVRLSSIMQP